MTTTSRRGRQAPHRPGLVRVVLPDVYLELATDAGVFSPGRLDPGTRLLLDEAPPPPPAGDLLDLGCGYGPIACVLAKRSPGATVWAVDVNERALELCARNAATAGLPNVRCVTPDDPSVPPRLAGIWSNPPVRIGKAALHDLLSAWLGRLSGGGSRRCSLPRGRAQPRRRFAAPLAGRAGVEGDAEGRAERLPSASGRIFARTSRGDSPVTTPVPPGGFRGAPSTSPGRGQAAEP